MPTVLLPAEGIVGPLALGLQRCRGDGPAPTQGSQGPPSSLSSSSSADEDLDFQSPVGSQGHRPGKGEPSSLRPRADPGRGWGAAPVPPAKSGRGPSAGSRTGVAWQSRQRTHLRQGSVVVTWLRRGRTTPKIC